MAAPNRTEAPDAASTLQLKIAIPKGRLPDVPVHRYRVVPIYGDGRPVTILLVQFSPVGVPTRAVAIRAEEDALDTFIKTINPEFRAIMEKSTTRDPASVRLTDEHMEALKHLAPDYWVNATLAAASAASSFNGADIEWYEVSAMSVHRALKKNMPVDAMASFRTPMPTACLLGMIRECEALPQREVETEGD